MYALHIYIAMYVGKKKFPSYVCHLKYKSDLESGKIFF